MKLKHGLILFPLLIVGILFANFTIADVSYDEQVRVPAIIIGKTDGSGGVTQFNGTMINNSPDAPITMGDDLRVDGSIWRSVQNDSTPVKISDPLEVSGSRSSSGLSTGSLVSSSITTGSIDATVVNADINAYSADVSNLSADNIDAGDIVADNITPEYSSISSLGKSYSPWNKLYVRTLYFDYIGYSAGETKTQGEDSPERALIDCTEENYGKMTFSKTAIGEGGANQFYGCTGTGWKEL